MEPIVKLKLNSDFEDYYDSAFAQEGNLTFPRLTSNEIPRKELYKLIGKHKLIPPVFGKVKKFIKKIPWEQAVIVFSNADLHSGGEKTVMSFKEAYKEHPDKYMSIYSVTERGESFRYLQIGKEAFFLRYKSDVWDSTKNPKIEVERVEEGDEIKMKPFDYPMYAVDFVRFEDRFGKEWMLAVDFNTAPILKGTGIEELIAPFEIVALLQEWYEEQGNKKKGLFR